jgi:ACR3 family arsenite transporter
VSTLLRPIVMAARYGRSILVLGLVLGIALPDMALAMKPWIGELVAGLLFISALRVGPRRALGALADMRASLGFALVCQVSIPVAAILLFAFAGWSGALATGLVLMLAAPPISGSPNLTVLTGNDPAPALRQLVIGTALLPATVIPVFWLAPALGAAGEVIGAASRLLLIIGCAAGTAFLIRGFLLKTPSREALEVIDGLSALAMAVVVVGLMSAVGPAIRHQPDALLLALAAAFAGNFGLQISMAIVLRRLAPGGSIAPLSIGAGNRNIALFLTVLPSAVTDPLLLFIGCYQIPMYLTPILLGRLYRPAVMPRC